MADVALSTSNDFYIGELVGDSIQGFAGDDQIAGIDGDDTIFAGIGNDFVDGGNDNDFLYGEGGNDEIVGGLGNDEIFGGSGNDVLNGDDGVDFLYGGSNDDEIFGGLDNDILFGETGSDYLSGGQGNDLLSGGVGNDALYGDDGADFLEGFDGNDFISGGSDNDGISGGVGDDTLQGDEGNDSIDASTGNDQLLGGVGNDTLDGSSGIDTMYGQSGNDTYIVDNAQDVVIEEGVADTADVVFSSIGYTISANVERLLLTGIENINARGNNQTNAIFGNSANNIFTTSDGNDTINGGVGFDTADYSSSLQAVTLKAQGVLNKGFAGIDNLTSIEKIIGTNGQDNVIDTSDILAPVAINVNLLAGQLNVSNVPGIGSLNFQVQNFVNVFGGGGDDVIMGGSGNNTLKGNGGIDVFSGSQGSDIIDGGASTDTVNYSGLNQAITIAPQGVLRKGTLGIDRLSGIETIIGQFGLDNSIDGSTNSSVTALSVNLAANSLQINNIPGVGNLSFTVQNFASAIGGNANDSFVGNVFSNSFTGNVGNDLFFGTNGDDRLDGGIGVDTVDYQSLGAAITIKPQGIIDKGGAGLDRLIGIETIIGSVSFINSIDASSNPITTGLRADLSSSRLIVDGVPGLGSVTFNVRNFSNVIGGQANDLITGNNSANTLIGNGGNDGFNGTQGFDTVNGGVGVDNINYTGLGQAITLRPQGVIDKGVAGIDQLIGIETIIGQAGLINVINASTNPSTVSIVANLAVNQLSVNNIPGVGNLSFAVVNFVNATGGAGNDTFAGNASSNLLVGNAGDEAFTATQGNDTLNGGTGVDFVNYTGIGQAITLRPQGVVNKGIAGTDQLIGIETIIGQAGLANAIDASTNPATVSIAANLTTNQLAVNNIPLVGNLALTVQNFVNVTGGAGNDSFVGNSVNNLLVGNAGSDSFSFSQGSDILNGGLGVDTVNYSGLGQAITLRPQGVLSKGTAGVDKLIGIETIIGQAGLANTIDASTNPATVSIIANLATNQLAVNNIPTIGNLAFSVVNFLNVIGGAGNDSITGNGLNNNLIGNAGNDRLSGGGGSDRFQFSGGTLPILGVDTITDFAVAVDTIVLSKATFTALTTAAGVSIGSQFAIVANDALVGASSASIIYSQSTGDLFYNQNLAVAGFGTNGGRFADLSAGLVLTSNNFVVIA